MARQNLSSARGNQADEETGVEVHLNVYDLLVPQIPASMTAAMYHMGVGFYHSGVSIFGTEYCYGGHPDDSTGVFEVTPKEAPEARFRETIIVGKTMMNPIDVAILVNQMAASSFWRGNSYNLLTRNCNHFASELCEKLTGRSAPSWINRLAWMGEKAKFLLPEGIDTPTAAPVQAAHIRPTRSSINRAQHDGDPDAE